MFLTANDMSSKYEQERASFGFQESAQIDTQDEIVIFCSSDVSTIQQDSQFLMEDFEE